LAFRSVTFDCPSKCATINSLKVLHLGPAHCAHFSPLAGSCGSDSSTHFPHFPQPSRLFCGLWPMGYDPPVSHLRPASDFDCLFGRGPTVPPPPRDHALRCQLIEVNLKAAQNENFVSPCPTPSNLPRNYRLYSLA